MANSQNGWRVDRTGDEQDRAPLVRNVTVPNGVRKGDVAVVFRWLARQYDARVERLIPGWCWGWFVKQIEGSNTISNHASGTAVDFNAPDNPMGSGTTARSLTPVQIRECHQLEEESFGVLRWGGDFGRNDPMHWEIVASEGKVKRFADKIRAELAGEEDDMDQEQFTSYLKTGLKAAAKEDPFATLLARTDASANRSEPALDRELDTVRAELAEVKATLKVIITKLDERDPA